MAPYMTPGVHVEEIPKLPPSVAEVSTAIPAFIGYTEKVPQGSVAGRPAVARITTLLEYTDLFGGPQKAIFTVQTDERRPISVTRNVPAHEFRLFYAISHYFKNGGGACYIVSAGLYSGGKLEKRELEAALTRLEEEDEPTLIVQSDAIALPSALDYYDLCGQALKQCNKLRDRFAIFDVKQSAPPALDTDVATLRGASMSFLAYGAAYSPYLDTLLTYDYDDRDVAVFQPSPWSKVIVNDGLSVTFAGESGVLPVVEVVVDSAVSAPAFSATPGKLTIKLHAAAPGKDVFAAWTAWTKTAPNDPLGFALAVDGTGEGTVVASQLTLGGSRTLESMRQTETALYNQIKTKLAEQRVELPPSAAVAGVYASVDRERGVWKAPANVPLQAVSKPVLRITDEQQERLNVHAEGGKSINAIRAFNGKGTLVWGARTLAGNDNEWRYVPVRRLFIMIEESARKATSFAVFEPNDMTTWLKVKGMIESFLYSLWERGALAGSKPESAYFVNVGLGKTMTSKDVLEGRMIVEIGIAAVRPAEFIILRFMHKLQEA